MPKAVPHHRRKNKKSPALDRHGGWMFTPSWREGRFPSSPLLRYRDRLSSYDLIESFLASYGHEAALQVGRDLDAKVEELLQAAAN